MSNYLAIATVTATLQRTLQAAVQGDVEGARVTTVRPGNMGSGTPETGVNVFLYQVSRNPALNNADATPMRTKGLPVKRQAALDLYYMLSFYGNDVELEPQRLLGSIVRTLNDNNIFSAEAIRETVADSTFTFLMESNLADQVQQVLIVPQDVSLEDLSKAWSVFQTPYLLSTIYKVTVVMIEGDEVGRRALPVRDRGLGGMVPFPSQPVVDQVIAQSGRFDPILAQTTLLIRGRQLKGTMTQVRIGGIEVTPIDVSDTDIILPLASIPPEALRAGAQGLQVIHRVATGVNSVAASQSGSQPGSQYRAIESNVAPFVLRPTLKTIEVVNWQDQDEHIRSVDLIIEANLIIGVKQRVVVALNEWTIDDPATYLFDAALRDTDTYQITVPIPAVKPGEYLVRLQVDGAENQLTIDQDPESHTFNWYNGPRVVIE